MADQAKNQKNGKNKGKQAHNVMCLYFSFSFPSGVLLV